MDSSRQLCASVVTAFVLLTGCASSVNPQQEIDRLKSDLKVADLRVLASGSSCGGVSERCLEIEAESNGAVQVPRKLEAAFDSDKKEFERRLHRAGIALKPGRATLFRWDFKADSGMCKSECNAYLLVPEDSNTIYIGLYSF